MSSATPGPADNETATAPPHSHRASLSAIDLGFDPGILDAWLHANIPGAQGLLEITPIVGGQSNPTFFVTYPGRRIVLRKRPAGTLLPSAHAVDREHRIMAVLKDSGVPVPDMLACYPGSDVVGTPFHVMDRLEGRVFSDCSLPGVLPTDRRAMYFDMANMLARLHRVQWQALGFADYGPEGNFFARQIKRWSKQWALSKNRQSSDIDRLMLWLPAHVPAGDLTTIAHGDYRIGNLMFHPTQPRIVGVLDWELSTLGHPLSDLAYSALAWDLLPTEYMGMHGLDHARLRISGQDAYLARYCAGSPDAGEISAFHKVFSLFRLAVIFEGIAARAQWHLGFRRCIARWRNERWFRAPGYRGDRRCCVTLIKAQRAAWQQDHKVAQGTNRQCALLVINNNGDSSHEFHSCARHLRTA